MTTLPALGFPSNAARTQGEMKTVLDDMVAFLRERGGEGLGWVTQAGAATINLGALTGRLYSITGGPAITSFGTTAPGDSFPWLLKMAARTTITQGANLKVQGLANNGDVLTLEVDDIIVVWWEGSNVWRVTVFSRASGMPATVAPGIRNRIINGDFRVDQRNVGTSIAITAGAALKYGVDRWYLACTGANATAQQVTAGGKWRLLVSGASGVTAAIVGQRIERQNCDDLANGRASLSVDIQAVGALATVNYAIYYANSNDSFGTIASPTRTSITSGSLSVTTTDTRYTIPNIAIPSGATTGIEIVFSTGALGAGTGFYLGNVQFEPGAFCTPFDRRPFQDELALCQRYFEKTFDQSVIPADGTNNFNGAITTSTMGTSFLGNATFVWQYKVEKRTNPNTTPYNPRSGGVAGAASDSASADGAVSGIGFGTRSTAWYNSGSALTANAFGYLHATASAEL